jgi:hypothetical protein
MGPVVRGRLGRAVAIIPQVAERVIEREAVVNVGVFEKGFASKVARMMVVMIRTGHLECGMLECNVLACEGLCDMRSA